MHNRGVINESEPVFSENYYRYEDWDATTEEIHYGLWMAKVHSRYQLSDHLTNNNGLLQIVTPGEFPEYSSPSFCVNGVIFTNLHAQILPFIVHVNNASNNLKCIKVSFFQQNEKNTNYLYTLYCDLNRGNVGLTLNHRVLQYQTTESYLPLLTPNEFVKQKSILQQKKYSLSKPKTKINEIMDNEIEIQTAW